MQQEEGYKLVRQVMNFHQGMMRYNILYPFFGIKSKIEVGAHVLTDINEAISWKFSHFLCFENIIVSSDFLQFS
jgi:hypothetical protein